MNIIEFLLEELDDKREFIIKNINNDNIKDKTVARVYDIVQSDLEKVTSADLIKFCNIRGINNINAKNVIRAFDDEGLKSWLIKYMLQVTQTPEVQNIKLLSSDDIIANSEKKSLYELFGSYGLSKDIITDIFEIKDGREGKGEVLLKLLLSDIDESVKRAGDVHTDTKGNEYLEIKGKNGKIVGAYSVRLDDGFHLESFLKSKKENKLLQKFKNYEITKSGVIGGSGRTDKFYKFLTTDFFTNEQLIEYVTYSICKYHDMDPIPLVKECAEYLIPQVKNGKDFDKCLACCSIAAYYHAEQWNHLIAINVNNLKYLVISGKNIIGDLVDVYNKNKLKFGPPSDMKNTQHSNYLLTYNA